MQQIIVQAFLNFLSFDFGDFQFNKVYNSILFSSLLVLLSNLDLRGFRFPQFFMGPHINSVNRGMPVFNYIGRQWFQKRVSLVNFIWSRKVQYTYV